MGGLMYLDIIEGGGKGMGRHDLRGRPLDAEEEREEEEEGGSSRCCHGARALYGWEGGGGGGGVGNGGF